MIDPLGAREITKAYRAEVDQRCAVGKSQPDELGGCTGEKYLITVRGGHDSRSAIRGRAEEHFAVPLIGCAMGPA